MRITAYTDYALRVLIYLAARDGARVPIGEIAAAYGISHNHLMKIANDLRQRGFVETARGKAGGMTLARNAGEIRIGDVLREMEPDLDLVECFRADDRCAITASCRLKRVLAQALRAFLAELDRTTLADVVRDSGRGLRRELGLVAMA